jgi:hypothetical protein
MIAFGDPFIQMLEEAQLTLTEYLVLYCHVFDKKHLIERYDKIENYSTDTAIISLLKKKFLVRFKDAYMATDVGDEFIRDHVSSYQDAVTDNPLLGEEDLDKLSESSYEEGFQKLVDTYPVKVRRQNGVESYLKEGTKDIKKLYIKAIESKQVTGVDLQRALDYYVRRYADSGNVAYMKTLKNWFAQDIWKDVLSNLHTESVHTNKRIDYGGKVD